MDVRELRIGNYVKSIGIEYVVWKIDALGNIKGIEGSTTFNLDKTAEPIQLTEEWLLKFGFEEDYQNDFMIFFNGRTYYYNLKSGFLMKDFKIKSKLNQFPIKHVHQLQNLYFALTGEELTLND